MKILLYITFSLMILLKTETVFSNESIFIVNNIKISKNSFKNKEELINKAFISGFKKLNQKILLEQDYNKIQNTKIDIIKNLVSHYQIIQNSSEIIGEETTVNIFFKRDKFYNFFYKNNIKYSDVSGKEIKIFPIIIKNQNIYIYDGNFFYNNWSDNINSKSLNSETIDFILPIESLEIIENIKKNRNNLESIKLSDLFDEHLIKDNLFIIINYQEKEIKVFFKGIVSSNKVIKNITIDNTNDNNDILNNLKKQVFEIIKSQNIIDVQTPSFLKINLSIKKISDLLKIQNILEKIDLIENFHVKNFNKDSAEIKIKYYGKINVISEKLLTNGIKIKVVNNEWKVSVE